MSNIDRYAAQMTADSDANTRYRKAKDAFKAHARHVEFCDECEAIRNEFDDAMEEARYEFQTAQAEARDHYS